MHERMFKNKGNVNVIANVILKEIITEEIVGEELTVAKTIELCYDHLKETNILVKILKEEMGSKKVQRRK